MDHHCLCRANLVTQFFIMNAMVIHRLYAYSALIQDIKFGFVIEKIGLKSSDLRAFPIAVSDVNIDHESELEVM
jgi:hypothetical protein